MQKIKIGIDLDITLFDTDEMWLSWLENESRGKPWNHKKYLEDKLRNDVDYNLTNYFPSISKEDGFKYWSDPLTYKECNIHTGAKNVIKELYQANCEIIFISYCMNCPDQIKYKIERLKDEFDFMMPDDFNFIPAKKKHLVKCDILVDDRNSFLVPMDEGVTLIKWDSPYQQEINLDRPHHLCKTWQEVEDVFCKALED